MSYDAQEKAMIEETNRATFNIKYYLRPLGNETDNIFICHL